jgi:DNA-binding IclR family transcriptional regulator
MKIKSLVKAVEILNCFSLSEPVQGIADISRATGYTKSTVSRMLSTLNDYGCVEKTGGYGKYRLGYRIFIWGTISQKLNSLPTVAKPVMEKLRSECGEEVSLYTLEGNRRVCIMRVESLYEVARVGTMGNFLPLHAGAAGRVLLAYLPAEQAKDIIYKNPLQKFTDLTITNPNKLGKSLREIRKKGYGISRGERESDAYSVVAPVWGPQKNIMASLSISGPNFRLNPKTLRRNIQGVLSAAREISHKLGHIEE